MEKPNITIKKMKFIYNALENGWSVKKKRIYIFFQKTMKVKKRFF